MRRETEKSVQERTQISRGEKFKVHLSVSYWDVGQSQWRMSKIMLKKGFGLNIKAQN